MIFTSEDDLFEWLDEIEYEATKSLGVADQMFWASDSWWQAELRKSQGHPQRKNLCLLILDTRNLWQRIEENPASWEVAVIAFRVLYLHITGREFARDAADKQQRVQTMNRGKKQKQDDRRDWLQHEITQCGFGKKLDKQETQGIWQRYEQHSGMTRVTFRRDLDDIGIQRPRR